MDEKSSGKMTLATCIKNEWTLIHQAKAVTELQARESDAETWTSGCV